MGDVAQPLAISSQMKEIKVCLRLTSLQCSFGENMFSAKGLILLVPA